MEITVGQSWKHPKYPLLLFKVVYTGLGCRGNEKKGYPVVMLQDTHNGGIFMLNLSKFTSGDWVPTT